ncbi:MAG: division/cell wall cluster transcriptional repressor MraZ [Eubacteriales bacterium]
MLIGEYRHSVDVKGRVFIPSKLREDLGEKFIVSKGIGNCLFVFGADEWATFSSRLKTLPIADKAVQDFLRMLFASACECELDKQGRALIPQRLRNHAGISDDAVIIGVMTRAEIWSGENWDKFNERQSEDFESALEKLSELGI